MLKEINSSWVVVLDGEKLSKGGEGVMVVVAFVRGGGAGGSTVFVLPDPRIAHRRHALSGRQTIVLGGLEHVLLDTHAVVVTPSQIVLCIRIALS